MFRAGRCYPKQVIYTPYQYPPQSTNVGGKKGISKN